MSSIKCCICGQLFEGWGNNPWPVVKDGNCCNECNINVVVPARIEMMNRANPNLSKCVTGASKSGVCGNRVCIEGQGINCCAACEHRDSCNSACGWLEGK